MAYVFDPCDPVMTSDPIPAWSLVYFLSSQTSLPMTITVNSHTALFLEGSENVYLIVVVPTGKFPGLCVWSSKVATPESSVALIRAHVATAVYVPGLATTTMGSTGQFVMMGGVVSAPPEPKQIAITWYKYWGKMNRYLNLQVPYNKDNILINLTRTEKGSSCGKLARDSQ